MSPQELHLICRFIYLDPFLRGGSVALADVKLRIVRYQLGLNLKGGK